MAWPLVQEGDRFWPVRTVQYLLVAQGHPVDVDSDFEQRTTAAVKAFQSEHGLEPDGKVGPLTWPLLVRPVDSRSEGADVRALQSLLTSAGLPTDITGRFTAATAHNLSSFQDTHHLPTTGQVDVRTWRVLLSAQAPPVRTVR
ncbi:hypothetical protein AAW14_11905 [Streptomyces hygroscopicus]|uniref:peptidoglycan-binding domain-containing protein n=1 Tax=Streptomyces hygroscopicus TaxID=1912 RepID=UPI0022405D67|nr:peptidoglycan-binding domain-containing protein [Streptomyces hygroscopicus]MCW7942723.1 hypothetical protein [Streptomyces hygroscopicus]